MWSAKPQWKAKIITISLVILWQAESQADLQGVKDYQLSACSVRMVDDNYITSPMWYADLQGVKDYQLSACGVRMVDDNIVDVADIQGVKDYQLSACGVRMVDDNIADVADIQGVKDYQLSACDVRMVDDNYITSPMWYVSSQLYQTVAGRLTGSKGLPAECLWCKDGGR
ncbi:hypothetical protein J6590_059225 [Homalodisca vitripennis]|nr:hypothetical protein J6590_059225 [Homalodisca vitripennis]